MTKRERLVTMYQGVLPQYGVQRSRYTAKDNTRLTGVLVSGGNAKVGIALNGRTEVIHSGQCNSANSDVAPDKRVFSFNEEVKDVHVLVSRDNMQLLSQVSVYLRVIEDDR